MNPAIFEYAEPDVAFEGTNYLVVWQQRSNDGRSIAGLRLPKAAAAPIDKDALRLSPISSDEQRLSPSLAFDGTSYFLTWVTSRPTASSIQVRHVYGTRVSKEGIALDGETVLCDAFLLQRAPRVAADPKHGGFFVAREDFRTALEAADVYGTRVSPKGENLDGTGGMKVATGTHDESRPHVAYAGDDANWVVAWHGLRQLSPARAGHPVRRGRGRPLRQERGVRDASLRRHGVLRDRLWRLRRLQRDARPVHPACGGQRVAHVPRVQVQGHGRLPDQVRDRRRLRVERVVRPGHEDVRVSRHLRGRRDAEGPQRKADELRAVQVHRRRVSRPVRVGRRLRRGVRL